MSHAVEIAFIGGGQMARCLVEGLLRRGTPPARIAVADPLANAREALATQLGVSVYAQAADAVRQAPVWVLAVKPQVAHEVCQSLSMLAVRQRPQVISIMAGVTLASLQQWLGIDTVVRSMPNQPAAIGAGITALHAAGVLDAGQRAQIEAVFSGAGATLWLHDEAQMDLVTAVAGSGPAYLCLLAEAMQHAAASRGLPADTARQLVTQTLLGAARMLDETDLLPAQLRERVTSPGGTTEAAIAVLQQAGWPQQVDDAVAAASARSRALATPPAQ
ncbi:pyrroline-5-carboxylate reductase [Stenotrophomonas sp. 24(2023)]|uniref:pyrroline-5-carboxylate reductase n=1 Tax=Stenotrophomonas sp. 24(2023) TaxID=3068324 RepID=UPI0027E1038F|nr:pyrroline-5-carboxylate reductase [Stenotrophomonas sp. 24(2023)]WMJ70609.1 pyrroline-5-carboxylate reductase [Stenotrophomonas sp. 24(2023)]